MQALDQTTTPAVSVLMAVHNGLPYLQAALDSIRGQTFDAYEFIIVNDGSTDESRPILEAAAAADPRIRLINGDTNVGLTRALNIGLEAARGTYVARMDSDDISHSKRLERQFAFLKKASDHVAVACGYNVIDGQDRHVRTNNDPLDDWQIRWVGGFNPPAPHPTYFFRRVDERGAPYLYDPQFKTAQDFDFWSRLADHGMTAVLADVLIDYRRHPDAITVKKRAEQTANLQLTGTRNLRKRLPENVVQDLEPLLAMLAHKLPANGATIAAVVKGCNTMLAYDLPRAPSRAHRIWAKRTAAGLLALAILSRGGALTSATATASFLFQARGYVLALAAKILESPGLAIKSLRAVRRPSG